MTAEHALRVSGKGQDDGRPVFAGQLAELLAEVLVTSVYTVKESDSSYSFHVYSIVRLFWYRGVRIVSA